MKFLLPPALLILYSKIKRAQDGKENITPKEEPPQLHIDFRKKSATLGGKTLAISDPQIEYVTPGTRFYEKWLNFTAPRLR